MSNLPLTLKPTGHKPPRRQRRVPPAPMVGRTGARVYLTQQQEEVLAAAQARGDKEAVVRLMTEVSRGRA